MTDKDRLNRIRDIIIDVDRRCLAADGPVTPTLQEMTQDELSRIYALASGKRETWKPAAFRMVKGAKVYDNYEDYLNG